MADVAILGAGAAGTFLLSRLVGHLVRREETGTAITVINPGPTLGRGAAFGTGNGRALLNRPTGRMDLAIAGDFAGWVARTAPGGVVDEAEFLPRRRFGDYLADMLAGAQRLAAERGIRIRVLADEAVSLRPSPEGRYRVLTAAGYLIVADRVVLALGGPPADDHYALRHAPAYVSEAPPFGPALAEIPAGARVGVLGSHLSGIDTAFHLLANGHHGEISLLSRSGRLPSVRGDNALWQLRRFTPERLRVLARDGLRLRDVLRELSAELRLAGTRFADIGLAERARDPLELLREEIAAAAAPIAWQSVLAATNEAVATCWSALPADERAWFLEHFHSRWMARRVPIPLVTARALEVAVTQGRITLVSGLDKVLPGTRSGFEVLANGRYRTVDWIVNCTGASRLLRPGASVLLDQLVAEGVLRPDPAGGAAVEFATCRALDRGNRVHHGLYAVGALTCGAYYVTSAIDVIGRQAGRVADHLAGSLSRPRTPAGTKSGV